MPISAETIPLPGDKDRLCDKCGAIELRRKTRSALNHMFFVQPYQCNRCAKKVNRFKFGWAPLFRLVLLLAFPVAVYYFVAKPNWFHRDATDAPSQAEALARARTSMGQLSTFEQMMIHKPKSTLDNATVVQLWKANVGPNVILQMIKTSNTDFDLSAGAIIELKEAGVDQTILLAMIDAGYGSR